MMARHCQRATARCTKPQKHTLPCRSRVLSIDISRPARVNKIMQQYHFSKCFEFGEPVGKEFYRRNATVLPTVFALRKFRMPHRVKSRCTVLRTRHRETTRCGTVYLWSLKSAFLLSQAAGSSSSKKINKSESMSSVILTWTKAKY